MFTLFILMFLISLVGVVVSLINPNKAVFWDKSEEGVSRGRAVKTYGLALLITLVLTIATAEKEPVDDKPVEATETEKESEPVKKEPVKEEVEEKFVLLDSDRELLLTHYSDIEDEGFTRLDEIEAGRKDLSPEDLEFVETCIARIEDELAEVAKLEKEKREKEEEEQRIAEEKEKAERYINTPSWNDLARDKNGLEGKFVKFKGKVIQVMQHESISQYRLAVDSNYDQVILVGIPNDKLEQNILDDDIITVEGMSLGITEYTTVMGAVRTIPLMLAENVYTK